MLGFGVNVGYEIFVLIELPVCPLREMAIMLCSVCQVSNVEK